VSVLSVPSAEAQAACPDLAAYYPEQYVDWSALDQRLAVLFPQCLDSAEFFALYGAAQLNNGKVAEAAESLERALLLEPDNGAAQVDYAQVLYLQGDLFSALAMNQQILSRKDLPEALRVVVAQRQSDWNSRTRELSTQLDLLAGYDSNLNGAPDTGQVTLTLAGEPIVLTLNEEFQTKSGPYINARLGSRYRLRTPRTQHNWVTEMRTRASEDTASDLLQFDGRYGFVRPGRQHGWQLNAGVSHLLFGGTSLYTATDTQAIYLPSSSRSCKPYYGLAVQHQLFHGQRQLDAVESQFSVGMNCPLARGIAARRQQLSAEVSWLGNFALESGRPGGDRHGWQANLNWQLALPVGELRSQLNHTQLADKQGYTSLLADGARRWLSRSYVLLQYRRPLFKDATLLLNLYRQRQRSNLELFRSIDSTVEIGISFAL
jgi:hypothetical protein